MACLDNRDPPMTPSSLGWIVPNIAAELTPGLAHLIRSVIQTIPVRGSIGTAPMIYFVFKHVVFNNLKLLEAVLVL